MKDHLGNKKESSTFLVEVLEMDIFHNKYLDGSAEFKVTYLLDQHGQEVVMHMYPTNVIALVQCPGVTMNDRVVMGKEEEGDVLVCTGHKLVHQLL